MTSKNISQDIEKYNTNKIYRFIKQLNVDLFGIADLNVLKNSLKLNFIHFKSMLENYKYAIVLGAQYQKLVPPLRATVYTLLLLTFLSSMA